MNVLSVFDGMSCGRIALDRAGIDVTNYFASEVDKAAIEVSKKNWPDIIQVGDVTKLQYNNGFLYFGNKAYFVGKIDLLIGGSPCQGFSFVGTLLNFEDEMSKLFFEYVRLLKEIKEYNPDLLFLLENVKMKEAWKDIISGYLGVKPIAINSALVSAQNRIRLYWTNIKGIKQPEDKGIAFETIIEKNAPKSFDHSEKALIYLDRVVRGGRTHWDFAHAHYGWQNKSQCLVANIYKGVPYNVIVHSCNGRIPEVTDSNHREFAKVNPGLLRYRKLTPLECERLQTVPEGYTSGVAKTHQYKMLGNGWTVDVISHILSHINKQV